MEKNISGAEKSFDDFIDFRNLPSAFTKIYGGAESSVRVFAAPARINIIGEHIDYNGGHVFPCAIDRYLYCAIRKRADDKIVYNDLKFPGTYSFFIDENLQYEKENRYANYLNGVFSILKKRGYKFDCGFDVLFASNIPVGSSISSSSALECGFGFALSETYNFNVSRKEIALIGQQSEHEFMNVNCGIMDQYIISTAKKNTAELLDCEKIEHEYIPLELGDAVFVVMDSRKKRSLAESKYNERRSECEKGLLMLKDAALDLKSHGKVSNTKDLPNLCALTVSQFEECKSVFENSCDDIFAGDVIFRRVRHCVTEESRVNSAVAALKSGNLEELGELMKASHESLHTDYEVTGLELNTLAAAANAHKGCLGSRMTGAGFSGCAIALVKKSEVESFIAHVQKAYTKTVGYEAGFFTCTPSDGTSELAI